MPPQRAQNTPVVWQVPPATLADETSSVLRFKIDRKAPYVPFLLKVYECHPIEGDDSHFLIDYASTRRVIGCATRFLRDSHDSSLLDFVLAPGVIAAVLAELCELQLFSEDCASLDQLCHRLLTWRNNRWDSLPEPCQLRASDLIFDKLELRNYYSDDNSPP